VQSLSWMHTTRVERTRLTTVYFSWVGRCALGFRDLTVAMTCWSDSRNFYRYARNKYFCNPAVPSIWSRTGPSPSPSPRRSSAAMSHSRSTGARPSRTGEADGVARRPPSFLRHPSRAARWPRTAWVVCRYDTSWYPSAMRRWPSDGRWWLAVSSDGHCNSVDGDPG